MTEDGVIIMRKVLKLMALMLTVCMIFTGCDNNGSGEGQGPDATGAAQNHDDSEPGTLKVYCFELGKADSFLIYNNQATIIIDAGERGQGKDILQYMENNDINGIDMMFITHFDKDHVGGADTVVEQIAVDRIILPAYEGTSSEYSDFMLAVENAGITPERVTEVQTLQLGLATATVEPPESYEIEDSSEEYDNNFSLITTVEFGSKRMVFAGDIEKKRIREWLAGGTAQQCDVLKVPHHGFYNAALEELFATLQPTYAVICDSEKNPAADKTLELLKKYGADYLETKDGDITILCDGENIEIHQ